ncbi:DUF411 domain-containing protein, partial [Sulfitobacter sp. 1A13679]|uniref:DUF411 domain-containing protein n=1 Tax=Sulfitobacter sp. 1A13679 TaxID=3368597 RepID=UPI003746DD3E
CGFQHHDLGTLRCRLGRAATTPSVEIIQRLTSERPEITGITLPGMPQNAPGMAGKSGTLKTYAFGKDGVAVYSNE